MADIHVLPVHHTAADQINRLHADLSVAYQKGLDLGSRVEHIQADGETLLSMCRELEQIFGALRQMLNEHDVQDRQTEIMVHRLIDEVHKLVDCAQRFPSVA